MIDGNWKIQIHSDPISFFLEIYIYQSAEDKTIVLQADGSQKEYDRYAAAQNPIPTFKATREALSELAKAINNFGIALPDQSFTAGELKATKEHLVDLRKLLKL